MPQRTVAWLRCATNPSTPTPPPRPAPPTLTQGRASEWQDHLVLTYTGPRAGGGGAEGQLDTLEAARLLEGKLKEALLADNGQLALARLAGGLRGGVTLRFCSQSTRGCITMNACSGAAVAHSLRQGSGFGLRCFSAYRLLQLCPTHPLVLSAPASALLVCRHHRVHSDAQDRDAGPDRHHALPPGVSALHPRCAVPAGLATIAGAVGGGVALLGIYGRGLSVAWQCRAAGACYACYASTAAFERSRTARWPCAWPSLGAPPNPHPPTHACAGLLSLDPSLSDPSALLNSIM